MQNKKNHELARGFIFKTKLNYLVVVFFTVVVVFLAVDVVFFTGVVVFLTAVVVFLVVVVAALTGVVVAAAVTAGAGVGMIELGSVAVGATAGASTVPLIFKTTGEFLALELTVTLLEKGPTLCVS